MTALFPGDMIKRAKRIMWGRTILGPLLVVACARKIDIVLGDTMYVFSYDFSCLIPCS